MTLRSHAFTAGCALLTVLVSPFSSSSRPSIRMRWAGGSGVRGGWEPCHSLAHRPPRQQTALRRSQRSRRPHPGHRQAKGGQAEMHQSETKFRTLVANLPAAVYRCKPDADYTMEFISDKIEEISGIRLPTRRKIRPELRDREISGYPGIRQWSEEQWELREPSPPRRFAMVADYLEKVARDEAFDLTYRLRHADGTVRWFQDRVRASRQRTGAALARRLDTRRHRPEGRAMRSRAPASLGTLRSRGDRGSKTAARRPERTAERAGRA